MHGADRQDRSCNNVSPPSTKSPQIKKIIIGICDYIDEALALPRELSFSSGRWTPDVAGIVGPLLKKLNSTLGSTSKKKQISDVYKKFSTRVQYLFKYRKDI